MPAWLLIFCLSVITILVKGVMAGGRWEVEGEVVMCAEWSRYQIMCARSVVCYDFF